MRSKRISSVRVALLYGKRNINHYLSDFNMLNLYPYSQTVTDPLLFKIIINILKLSF